MKTARDRTTLLSISAVERDVGIGKDTLRVWERRYGFPRPARDVNGDRVYPLAQVQRLRLIKRLLEHGLRPGKLLPLGLAQLTQLTGARAAPDAPGAQRLLQLLKRRRIAELRGALAQTLLRDGLRSFVCDTMAPLNVRIGEGWVRGEIAIFEEHLYTEIISGLLHAAIAREDFTPRPPRVLLTTFPNEQHGLGLLMVEALLRLESVECVALGIQVPTPDIVEAARASDADVVALSFSGAYSATQALSGVSDLRQLLPGAVEIWAGGSGATRIKRGLSGVKLLATLTDAVNEATAWRQARR